MGDFLNSPLGIVAIVVVVAGSLVDIFQFAWIVKRIYRRAKIALYHRVRKDILLSEHLKRVEGNKEKHEDYGRPNF